MNFGSNEVVFDSVVSVGIGINWYFGILSFGDCFMMVSMEVMYMCGIFWEFVVGLSGDGWEGFDID